MRTTSLLEPKGGDSKKRINLIDMADFDRLFGFSGPVSKRLERFLLEPRAKLRGCRIGRMVWDSAITEPDWMRLFTVMPLSAPWR
jgi:hypothetical protein